MISLREEDRTDRPTCSKNSRRRQTKVADLAIYRKVAYPDLRIPASWHIRVARVTRNCRQRRRRQARRSRNYVRTYRHPEIARVRVNYGIERNKARESVASVIRGYIVFAVNGGCLPERYIKLPSSKSPRQHRRMETSSRAFSERRRDALECCISPCVKALPLSRRRKSRYIARARARYYWLDSSGWSLNCATRTENSLATLAILSHPVHVLESPRSDARELSRRSRRRRGKKQK